MVTIRSLAFGFILGGFSVGVIGIHFGHDNYTDTELALYSFILMAFGIYLEIRSHFPARNR